MPRVLYAPESQRALIGGVTHLADLLRLTLGPCTPRIAVANGSIDLLDDSALLSKQLLTTGSREANAGHQMLRSALIGLDEWVSDGVATCAVLTAALLAEAQPLLAAGYHPVEISRGIRAAHEWVARDLTEQAWEIDTPREIAGVLRAANLPDNVAGMLAEIVDTVGADGSVVIEETRKTGIEHEYVRGGRWNTGLASPLLMPEGEIRVIAHAPRVLVTAALLTDAAAVTGLLDLLMKQNATSALLIAPEFSAEVIALLRANTPHPFLHLLAVTAPTSVRSGTAVLEDLALLCGARFIPAEDGNRVSASDFGGAGQAWATRSAFGVLNGNGDPQQLQERVRALRARAQEERDAGMRAHLLERAGTLSGVSALVRVGIPNGAGKKLGGSPRSLERGLETARHALRSGVVPGGGCALACSALRLPTDDVGARVIARALSAPLRAILRNAGVMDHRVMGELGEQGAGDVYDARARGWGDARVLGLADPLHTVRSALDAAISTASLVLSTDTLVLERM
jgi:chaperonin GroEL